MTHVSHIRLIPVKGVYLLMTRLIHPRVIRSFAFSCVAHNTHTFNQKSRQKSRLGKTRKGPDLQGYLGICDRNYLLMYGLNSAAATSCPYCKPKVQSLDDWINRIPTRIMERALILDCLFAGFPALSPNRLKLKIMIGRLQRTAPKASAGIGSVSDAGGVAL